MVVFHKSPSDGLYEVLVRRDEGWSLDILRHQMSAVQVATTTTTRWNCGLSGNIWLMTAGVVTKIWIHHFDQWFFMRGLNHHPHIWAFVQSQHIHITTRFLWGMFIPPYWLLFMLTGIAALRNLAFFETFHKWWCWYLCSWYHLHGVGSGVSGWGGPITFNRLRSLILHFAVLTVISSSCFYAMNERTCKHARDYSNFQQALDSWHNACVLTQWWDFI